MNPIFCIPVFFAGIVGGYVAAYLDHCYLYDRYREEMENAAETMKIDRDIMEYQSVVITNLMKDK